MSDEYHRPTYTSPDVHGAYNATQVRLYGIPGPSSPGQQASPKRVKILDEGQGVLTGYSDEWDVVFALMRGGQPGGAISPSTLNSIMQNIGKKSRLVQSSFVFISSLIDKYMVMLGAIDIGPPQQQRALSAGVIFGYSYEGHCYDLPKPKIMLIPAPPMTVPTDDCGYDKKKDPLYNVEYKVWIVDKLAQCVELEVNQGFVEQLVLEANLPGKRSPTMYAGRMLLGHKSGRLTE